MSILTRFRSINENDKAAVVRKLMEASTPNFDYFYITGLAVVMSTLGLLLNSPAVVIGSMLIAPVLYPILGISLGLVMSNSSVIGRSTVTLLKSFGLGLGLSVLVTILFISGPVETAEVMSRTEPNLLYFMVAVVAGAAVAFALAQPEWSETLPGIAVSVALIPPLSVMGIGLATLHMEIFTGSTVLLLMNLCGISFAAMVTFSLMNLYEKQHIAESTIKREEEKLMKENEAIEELAEDETRKSANNSNPYEHA